MLAVAVNANNFLPKIQQQRIFSYQKVRLKPRVVFSVAEWLACWTKAQKGPGSNRSRDAVLGKLFTPIVPLFNKQQNL